MRLVFFAARSTKAFTWFSSRASTTAVSALPPASRMSRATFCRRDSVRPARKTSAPSPRRPRQQPRRRDRRRRRPGRCGPAAGQPALFHLAPYRFPAALQASCPGVVNPSTMFPWAAGGKGSTSAAGSEAAGPPFPGGGAILGLAGCARRLRTRGHRGRFRRRGHRSARGHGGLRGGDRWRQIACRRSVGRIRRPHVEAEGRVFVPHQRHVGNNAVDPAVQADQQVKKPPAEACP